MLRFADLTRDEDLLLRARRQARQVVAEDPELAQPEHERTRRVLLGRHRERLELWKVG